MDLSTFEYEGSLLNLFNLWYGIKFIPTNQMKKDNLLKSNLPFLHLRKQWDEVWFAKKEKQIQIDKLLQKFEFIVNKYQDFIPEEFYEKMAMIILYDQIPRNIFRKTSKAYDYDLISRKIALQLAEQLDDIPFQYRLTVLICLCHSENKDHQTFIRQYVQKMLSDQDLYAMYKEIVNTMFRIADNHYIRINAFGRLPERNQYIGRINTTEEEIFLNNFK